MIEYLQDAAFDVDLVEHHRRGCIPATLPMLAERSRPA
jgi:hypothetical protein